MVARDSPRPAGFIGVVKFDICSIYPFQLSTQSIGFIHIPVGELDSPWKDDPERINHLYNVGIDYATNTIDAVDTLDDDNYVSIYCFSNMDFKLSNRWHTYELSKGPGGITITLIPTRKNV